MECCRDGCPSGRFSHHHRGTLELCQSDNWVLGHLPVQVPSPLIAQFGRAASSRKSLGGSKLLPFKHDGGHCVLGDIQCYRHFVVPFPVSECDRQFLRARGLLFTLTFTVNCGTYRCALFQIMSNHLNLPQVDSNQVAETLKG